MVSRVCLLESTAKYQSLLLRQVVVLFSTKKLVDVMPISDWIAAATLVAVVLLVVPQMYFTVGCEKRVDMAQGTAITSTLALDVFVLCFVDDKGAVVARLPEKPSESSKILETILNRYHWNVEQLTGFCSRSN